VTRVGVVGLGTMGAGIAQVCARTGLDTVGWEPSADVAARGRSSIERRLERDAANGKLTDAELADTLGRLTATDDLQLLADCDVVIEAVVEELQVKQQVFVQLEQHVAVDAVLATNTSALSVTEIAAVLERPERAVGMHFFNPVPVLPLVEVVRAELSSEQAVTRAVDLAREIGKQPIVCGDTPGFVVNRMLIPVLNEAVRAYEQGVASAEDIDLGMRAGTSWPIGPLALLDLIGIDTYVHVCDALWEAFHEGQFAAPPRLVRMARAGLLGRKSGRGFYDYAEEAAR
jgi:3-hydroxybutyryl-CoA dehydrogenase